jgi:MurNAc alpha-1-phosphate uridylyltransferase
VILAGGLATRLGALTQTTPKALLPVAGRPFLDWQLEAIARSGFSRVLLCTGHLGEQIERHLRGARFGLELQVSEDGPKLLGTAGALRHALASLEASFLVTYGDSYLPFDYSAPLRDLEAHPEALGCMSVYRNNGRWDASNTRLDGERVASYEKGGGGPGVEYIDYGAIALRREVIAGLRPDEPVGLDSVQSDLARRRLLRAYVARERFYEIGSEAGLRELEKKLGES